jgi:hypothetical protein
MARRTNPDVGKNETTVGKQVVPQVPTLTGKKRKQPKRAYVPKVPAAQPANDVNAGALVISGGNILVDPMAHAQAVQVEETSNDQNKKQRTTIDRSADPAVAVAQPRQTQ